MKITGDFNYRIDFSRRRSLSIIVSPDKGVVVKAPFRTPARTIERFVNEKHDWIVKSLNKFKSLYKLGYTIKYAEGDPVLFAGREYNLRLLPRENYGVRLKPDEVIEVGTNYNINPLVVTALLENWFSLVAKRELTHKFLEILARYDRYGFSPTGFAVRRMKSRWGSCSSKGNIALSYDLVRLADEYSEYVIIHELCHLKHHNHGAGFYSLLAELYPDWRPVREGLKKYIRC